MNKDEKAVYDSYVKALDECIKVAKQRAITQIEDAPSSKVLELDRAYLKATMDVEKRRSEWVKLRDAHWQQD